jgi:hypothetical protein
MLLAGHEIHYNKDLSKVLNILQTLFIERLLTAFLICASLSHQAHNIFKRSSSVQVQKVHKRQIEPNSGLLSLLGYDEHLPVSL